MGFSRQEHWSGLPRPIPGNLSDPGIKPEFLMSPTLTGTFFTTTWEVIFINKFPSWLVSASVAWNHGPWVICLLFCCPVSPLRMLGCRGESLRPTQPPLELSQGQRRDQLSQSYLITWAYILEMLVGSNSLWLLWEMSLSRWIFLCDQGLPGFPGGSEGKESACNAGDPGSIPESGRSPGKENGSPL